MNEVQTAIRQTGLPQEQSVLPSSLAYIVAAKLKLPTPTAEPQVEYTLFQQRNRIVMIDCGFLKQSRNVIAQFFLRRNESRFAFAVVSRSLRPRLRNFMVAGEDLGLPLAILDRFFPSHASYYIITHGSYMASPKFKFLMKLLRSRLNLHFLCLSESIRQALVDEFGLSPEQVHNTGYGIDTHFFQPVEQSSSPVIVSAGTASRDYKTLVEAVLPLQVPLKIAADSAWFPMRVNLDKSQLPAFIEVRSAGNYEGLRKLYAEASFVVVPLQKVKHACGYAVIGEAMAMGKPVIATRTLSVSDFIIEGETGYLVEPGDVEGLRAKIEYLLNHPEETKRMGQKARQLIEAEFSVEAYCAKMEAVIKANANRE